MKSEHANEEIELFIYGETMAEDDDLMMMKG